MDSGLAKPEEILVLAFNTDAAQEVRDRLTRQVEKNLAGLTVATFHAFGKAVATAGMPRQPSVSRLAQDDASLPEFVLARLASLAAEGGGLGDPDLRVFLERHLTPPDTESPDDLVAGFSGPTASGRTLLDSVRAASLRGDPMATADFRYRVRSNQEAQIANFLFLNQVEYLYEPDYESPTATFERRQYRPDFYLPQQKLYLEHFAVSHPSQTCPDFIPKDAYLEGVAWKRDLHRRHGTRMIETCSADANGPDGLIGALERALRQEGVELRPRPLAPLFADVDLRDRFDPRVVLVLLLTRFVTTAKVSLRSDAELQAAAREGGDRHIRFLSIAQRIRADYATELRGNAEIDFSDMLIDATERIRSGAYRSQFRYILVDEFQDLSTARASLILALRDTVPGSSIFGVGDDWQSVYGFTGSDVSWTTAFADRFGACAITALRPHLPLRPDQRRPRSRLRHAEPGPVRQARSSASPRLAGVRLDCVRSAVDPSIRA